MQTTDTGGLALTQASVWPQIQKHLGWFHTGTVLSKQIIAHSSISCIQNCTRGSTHWWVLCHWKDSHEIIVHCHCHRYTSINFSCLSQLALLSQDSIPPSAFPLQCGHRFQSFYSFWQRQLCDPMQTFPQRYSERILYYDDSICRTAEFSLLPK